MAHYAEISAEGTVLRVIVAEQDFIDLIGGNWIQTSYNTRGGVHYNPETGEPSEDQAKALRKNFAGIGYTYDPQRDAFIPPKPEGDTWILNEETCFWDSTLPPVEPDENTEPTS
jgi:hypothetical protein